MLISFSSAVGGGGGGGGGGVVILESPPQALRAAAIANAMYLRMMVGSVVRTYDTGARAGGVSVRTGGPCKD